MPSWVNNKIHEVNTPGIIVIILMMLTSGRIME